jgi:hypothetical protein
MCEIRKVTDYAKYLHLLLKLNKPSYPRKLQGSIKKNRKNGMRSSTERERIATHCFSKSKRTRISCSSESVKNCNVVRWTFTNSTLLSRNVLHFLVFTYYLNDYSFVACLNCSFLFFSECVVMIIIK